MRSISVGSSAGALELLIRFDTGQRCRGWSFGRLAFSSSLPRRRFRRVKEVAYFARSSLLLLYPGLGTSAHPICGFEVCFEGIDVLDSPVRPFGLD
jgi:hypothetical protein